MRYYSYTIIIHNGSSGCLATSCQHTSFGMTHSCAACMSILYSHILAGLNRPHDLPKATIWPVETTSFEIVMVLECNFLKWSYMADFSATGGHPNTYCFELMPICEYHEKQRTWSHCHLQWSHLCQCLDDQSSFQHWGVSFSPLSLRLNISHLGWA